LILSSQIIIEQQSRLSSIGLCRTGIHNDDDDDDDENNYADDNEYNENVCSVAESCMLAFSPHD